MLFSILASTLLQQVAADSGCECGYVTNTGDVWQSKISTSFAVADNGSASAVVDAFLADWSVSSVQRGDLSASVPYTINYTTANVFYPTVSSQALVLQASAYVGPVGGAVDSGQISTNRTDILYGSFRATYKVTGGSGAVAGFFSYADDENENDMEIVTADGTNEVHFTNQPYPGEGATYLYNGTATDVDHEYRFDWTSAGVTYFIDNDYKTDITTHPSTEASQILLNTWSNGGPFSSGPPTENAIMTVSSITLYFNSSLVDSATFDATCLATQVAVCQADPGVAAQDVPVSSTTTSTVASTSSSTSASSTTTTIEAKTTNTATSSTLAGALSATSVAAIAHAKTSAATVDFSSHGIMYTCLLALAAALTA